MKPHEGQLLAEFTNKMNSISDKDLADLAKTLGWGTFGPTGTEPRKNRYLNDLETSHLENIIVTQPQISPLYKKVILYILKSRWGIVEIKPEAKLLA